MVRKVIQVGNTICDIANKILKSPLKLLAGFIPGGATAAQTLQYLAQTCVDVTDKMKGLVDTLCKSIGA